MKGHEMEDGFTKEEQEVLEYAAWLVMEDALCIGEAIDAAKHVLRVPWSTWREQSICEDAFGFDTGDLLTPIEGPLKKLLPTGSLAREQARDVLLALSVMGAA